MVASVPATKRYRDQSVVASRFFIPVGCVGEALAAAQKFSDGAYAGLTTIPDDDISDLLEMAQAATNLVDFFEAIDWLCYKDFDGNISGVQVDEVGYFEEDRKIFERIAPYVRAGSFIDLKLFPFHMMEQPFEPEDIIDYQRWSFDGAKMTVRTGRWVLVWDDETPTDRSQELP